MSLTKKFVALGAAAAISATGLVAGTGTSADAANVTKSVTYNCDLSGLGLGSQPVTAAYSIPAFPASIRTGTAVPAKPITAKITLPATVSTLIVAGFQGKIDGSVTGNVTFGSKSVASSLIIPSQTITDPASPAVVNASGKLAGFTASTAGTQAVKLPNAVTATFQGGSLTVQCSAASGSNLSLASVSVKGSAALAAAKAKLAKDLKHLRAAKKALHKASGHKKVVLKKKVVKLTKKVKADRKKIKRLS